MIVLEGKKNGIELLYLLNVETLVALLFAAAAATVCDLVTLLVDDGVSIGIAENQEEKKKKK